MFFHSFIYTLKTLIRDKGQAFWCVLFPIVLATMFNFAFGNLDSNEAFSAIDVAVVIEEGKETEALQSALDSVSAEGENQLLNISYVGREAAEKMLAENKVVGILTAGDQLTLKVSAAMKNSKLEQSILKVFTEQYNLYAESMMDVMKTNPAGVMDLINQMNAEANYVKHKNFTEGNISAALTYFYNLIAMACLYGSFLGNSLAHYGAANLSAIGARRLVSPVNKFVYDIGSVCAAIVMEVVSITLSIFYIRYILGIDFGNQFGYVLLTVFVGCVLGVTLGYFIGNIGTASSQVKFGILISSTMICSVLSGLMFNGMRITVDQFCPVINKINPAALISDSFYSLVIYPDHSRYFYNVIICAIEAMVFIIGSFLLTRRKKYASL
ncbi:MAG: ABC transporter permease [Lachnospiraceae bacterium]|nr:ABC transporter permease [Lachnospiraceae bacterium]